MSSPHKHSTAAPNQKQGKRWNKQPEPGRNGPSIKEQSEDGYSSDYGGYSHSDYHYDNYSEKSSNQPVLFVGSLPPESTPQDLQGYFSQLGVKVSVKIIVDWITHRSKQCALIFCDSYETGEWLLTLNHEFNGKTLRLDWADNEKRGTKKIETNILFVGNIYENSSEDSIRAYFSKYGNVINIKCFSNRSTAPNCKNAFVKFNEGKAIDLILASRHNHRIEGKHVKVAQFKPNTKAYHMDTETTESKTRGSKNSGKEVSHSSGGSKPQSLISDSRQNQRVKPSFPQQQGFSNHKEVFSLQTRSEPMRMEDLPKNFNMAKNSRQPTHQQRHGQVGHPAGYSHLDEQYANADGNLDGYQDGYLRQGSMPVGEYPDCEANQIPLRQSSLNVHPTWEEGLLYDPSSLNSNQEHDQQLGWTGGLSSSSMMLAQPEDHDSGFSLSKENMRFGKSSQLDIPDKLQPIVADLEQELDDMALSQGSGLGMAQMIQFEEFMQQEQPEPVPQKEEPPKFADRPQHQVNVEVALQAAKEVKKPFCPFLCRHSHICISDMSSSEIFKAFCPSSQKQ